MKPIVMSAEKFLEVYNDYYSAEPSFKRAEFDAIKRAFEIDAELSALELPRGCGVLSLPGLSSLNGKEWAYLGTEDVYLTICADGAVFSTFLGTSAIGAYFPCACDEDEDEGD